MKLDEFVGKEKLGSGWGAWGLSNLNQDAKTDFLI